MRSIRNLGTIATAFSLLATPSGAQHKSEQAPDCYWDSVELRFSESRVGIPAWVSPAGSEFVSMSAVGDERSWLVLHHCASDHYLMAITRPDKSVQFYEKLDALIRSKEKFTMDEIAGELEKHGASVRRGQNDIGRCDCDAMARMELLK